MVMDSGCRCRMVLAVSSVLSLAISGSVGSCCPMCRFISASLWVMMVSISVSVSVVWVICLTFVGVV